MGVAAFETIDDGAQLSRVRAFVAEELRALERAGLIDDAVLVASELASNALLHADGIVTVSVTESGECVRISVQDRTRVPPVMARQSVEAMTGRGLRLVASLSTEWGAEPSEVGKVVWADLSESHASSPFTHDLIEMWDDDGWLDAVEPVRRYPVWLGEVPTPLLLSAKAHVDNLVREFTLAARGAESNVSGQLPPHLATLIETVVTRFSEARQAIKRQALAAANMGLPHVRLELNLPASAADAGEEYLRALDEADSYCHAARLLTVESPPQHQLFRHWYVGELVAQLRAAEAGLPPPKPVSFDERLLQEFDKASTAQATAGRVARLYELSAALARAASREAVAAAVLEQGVAALDASGGGVLLAADADHLVVPGTFGYEQALVDRLQGESKDADLPAAVALRTGEPVWIESRQERDTRFPELSNLERGTVATCAVPLSVGDHRLGALRFSFPRPRLFDEDERRFVLALAAQTSQALYRAQAQRGAPGVQPAAAAQPATPPAHRPAAHPHRRRLPLPR